MTSPDFLRRHVRILCHSYATLTGRSLLEPGIPEMSWVEALDAAPFAVVSHGVQSDPVFNYGNRKALELFELDWARFTQLPSRYSAESMVREERNALLARVARDGYVHDYGGVRVSATGRRFMVRNATVWNLVDETDQPYGQAALLKEWSYL